jgi:hypothetical protein
MRFINCWDLPLCGAKFGIGWANPGESAAWPPGTGW